MLTPSWPQAKALGPENAAAQMGIPNVGTHALTPAFATKYIIPRQSKGPLVRASTERDYAAAAKNCVRAELSIIIEWPA